MALTFNETFYLENNPDVQSAVLNGVFTSGLQHFQLFGANELRDPNATFDTSFYANQNPDVVSAIGGGGFGGNLFDHFTQFGAAEGRIPDPELSDFDAEQYLAANPDVQAAVDAGTIPSAMFHFLQFGQNEGRDALDSDGDPIDFDTGITGDTFALTAGVDSITGTENNDAVTGVVESSGAANDGSTFTSGDSIDGGAGTDTLSIRVTDLTNTATTTTASVSGVETVRIKNLDPGNNAYTYNAGTTTGLNSIGTEGGDAASLTNVTGLSSLNISAFVGGEFDTLDFDYDATLTGDSDEVKVTTSGAESASIVNINEADDAIETLTFTAEGDASDIGLDVGTALETVNASGAGDLDIDDGGADSFDAVETVDASGMTGKFTFTTGDGNAENMTITTGSGDDIVNFTNDLDDDDTIDLGDGKDRIGINEAVTVEDLKLSNIEEYEAITIGGAVDFDNISGTILSNAANGDTLNNVDLSNDLVILGATNGNLTVGYDGADAPGATSDAVSVTFGDATSETQADMTGDTLTVDNVETINAVSADVTDNATGTNIVGSFDGDAVDAFNLTGEGNFTITFAAASDQLTSVDATGMSGDGVLDVDITNLTQGTKITLEGTANDDTITVDSGTTATQSHDVIGGEGADTIELTGAGAAAATRIVYNSVDDGGAKLAEDLAAGDVIGNDGAGNLFDVGVDSIVFTGDLGSNLEGTSVDATATQNNVDLDSGDGVFFFDGDILDLTAGDETNFTTVETAIGDLNNETVGDGAIIVLEDDSDASAAIFAFQSVTADDEVGEDELQLLGVVHGDAVIPATDFSVV